MSKPLLTLFRCRLTSSPQEQTIIPSVVFMAVVYLCAVGLCYADSNVDSGAGLYTDSNAKHPSTKDCTHCPEMIQLPAGRFTIGTEAGDPGHVTDEAPKTAIDIASFYVSRFEITRGQFKQFVDSTGAQLAKGCLVMGQNGQWQFDPNASWQNPGFEQTDDHPAVCITWVAANRYVNWLNQSLPADIPKYRLLTESEWDYSARAGSRTTYWWGNNEDDFCEYTNGADKSTAAKYPSWKKIGQCSDGFIFTAPVGHYQSPNQFGVEDMVGNVWEWVQDCYYDSYADLPRDGTAQTAASCEKRVMRGGAWGDYGAFYLRSAYRGAWSGEQSFSNLGFRIARDR